MNRLNPRNQIILASIATLLLAPMLIYQSYQLYEKKSEELNNHIENVLSKVAIRHEKAADLQRYTTFFGKGFIQQYKQALKQEFKNISPVKESVSITDTVIIEEGRPIDYLYITGSSYDSLAHVTAKHSVLARNLDEMSNFIRQGANSNQLDSGNTSSFQIDKKVIRQLFKKSKYINDMMVNAFRNNNLLTPNQRIDLFFLDSILSYTLKAGGITTPFEYAIYDSKNKIVEFPSYTDYYSLEIEPTEGMEARLFPGDIFDELLTLHITFPKRSAFLYKEIGLPIAICIVLFVLVVLAFFSFHKSNKYQKQLAEIKNDFISNMTHELKTPISTISLACEAMSDQDMNKDKGTNISPFVKVIADENKRLGGLVEQILKSTVLDQGNLKMKNEPLELNEIVSSVVSKAKIRVKNGSIQLNLATGLLPFEGDPVHINNMVSNLVDNAIKYSKEIVEISITTEKITSEEYRLIISDKGIGIKNEYLNKIFDKLYRVPTGNVHNVKGYGLGLNYVKAIVDIKEWDIKVKSKFGKGTDFIITIKNEKKDE